MLSYINLFMLIFCQSCLCLQRDNYKSKCSDLRTRNANLLSYHDKIGIPRALEIEYGPDFLPTSVVDHAYFAGLIITIQDINGTSNITYSVCSASLISANRLLTAAHCWRDHLYQAHSMKVVLGARTLEGKGGVTITTNKVLMHPLYNPLNYLLNNIAMVNLPQPLKYTDRVNPISLPSYVLTRQNRFLNTIGEVIGYAITPDDPWVDLTSVRYSADVLFIGQSECREVYGNIIDTSHLCSKLTTEDIVEIDTCDCPGDTGGPLIVAIENRQIILGIAIMSNRIGCPRSPAAVYTRILYYLDFIYENID